MFHIHSSGGNISCVVVFVCLYYFMVAGGLWIIILAYSLHTSFKSYGEKTQNHSVYNVICYVQNDSFRCCVGIKKKHLKVILVSFHKISKY